MSGLTYSDVSWPVPWAEAPATVRQLVDAGFEPTSVVAAVSAGNIRLLKRGAA